MATREEAVIRQYLTLTPMGCGRANVPTEYRRSFPVNRGGSEAVAALLALVVSSAPLRDPRCGALRARSCSGAPRGPRRLLQPPCGITSVGWCRQGAQSPSRRNQYRGSSLLGVNGKETDIGERVGNAIAVGDATECIFVVSLYTRDISFCPPKGQKCIALLDLALGQEKARAQALFSRNRYHAAPPISSTRWAQLGGRQPARWEAGWQRRDHLQVRAFAWDRAAWDARAGQPRCRCGLI
jgi:hypothetical protein